MTVRTVTLDESTGQTAEVCDHVGTTAPLDVKPPMLAMVRCTECGFETLASNDLGVFPTTRLIVTPPPTPESEA